MKKCSVCGEEYGYPLRWHCTGLEKVPKRKIKPENPDGEITLEEYPNPTCIIKQGSRKGIVVRNEHEARLIRNSMNNFLKSFRGDFHKNKKVHNDG